MERRDSLTASATRAASDNGSAGYPRAGFIGAGFIGRVHARSARLAGGRIAGVTASSTESTERARADLDAAVAFGEAAAMIASDDIDVIHICAPNDLHHGLAKAALEAGKHIICEKPVALTADEATELTAIAEREGLVATVPFAYRYYPTVREARARVSAGEVGDINLIYGGYLQDWLLDADDDNWRVDSARGGRSRAFADIGSHWCDLIEFVSGQRIVSLTARTAIAHEERRESDSRSFERGSANGTMRRVDTEDLTTVMFETDAGVIGSATISQVSPGRKNNLWFEISGTESAVAFNQENPEVLWAGDPTGSRLVPRDANTLHSEAAAYVTLPGGHPQGFHDCFDAFVAETYAAIRGDSPADGLPKLEDGLRAVRLTEAVLASADSREWVEVAT